MYGVNSLAQNSASGHTVTNLIAVNAQPYAVAGAIVTTGYGFNLAAVATASTWTTFYGIRLQAWSGPTITNRWGISQEDSAAKSVFYGNVGVGSSLDVGTGKAIASLTLTAGGTLYTNGAYSQVALTGGTGTGATADIVISGNAVTTVVLRAPGQGYVAGDVLSVNAADVGGTGSGFQTTVATVASILRSDGQVVAPRIGAGTTASKAALDVNGQSLFQGFSDFNEQGYSGFTVTTNVAMSIFGSIAPSRIWRGIVINPLIDTTGSSVPSAYGIHSEPSLTITGAAQSASVFGISSYVYRSYATDVATNATITCHSANLGIRSTVGAATTASANGYTTVWAMAAAGHTITTASAFDFTPGSISCAITTLYGLRLRAASGAGTITNRWGISQEDSAANNLFAGVVIHGSGEASASPVGQTLRGPSGSGSNIAGGSITIAGGNSTGSGAGGSIIFQTAAAGGAGSGANTLTTRASIDSAGNLAFNSGFGSAATAYGCRAWVNFNGTGTVAIRSSGNVTSITDNGVGDYTVNMTNAMSDANYAIACSVGGTNGVDIIRLRDESTARTTTAFRLLVMTNGFVQADSAVVNAMVVR